MGIKEIFAKQQANIRAASERNEERIRVKAERDLENARSESKKAILREKREQELQKLKREVSEAKIATNKAKQATLKAKAEANDVKKIGGGSSALGWLAWNAPTKPAAKKKPKARPITPKRRKLSR